MISKDQGGSHAGQVVEVLADDYTSKGDEEMLEVKIGDDVIFVEKKFISLKGESLEPVVDEDFTLPGSTSISGVANVKEEEEEELEDDEEEFVISLSDLDDVISDDDDDKEDDEELTMLDLTGNDEEEDDDEDDDEDDNDDEEEETISISDLDDSPEGDNNVGDTEKLSSKLRKSLEELEDIRSEMNNTFTSTDTITGTITSLKGMLDALKKDQENLKK